MAYLNPDIQKKCCLTCQYYRFQRTLKIIGTKVFIDHPANGLGECSIVQDQRGNPFRRHWGEKPPEGQICRYKRWVDLP